LLVCLCWQASGARSEILAVLMAASKTGEHRLFFGSVLVVASLTALADGFLYIPSSTL
jgi:hypothetical protein